MNAASLRSTAVIAEPPTPIGPVRRLRAWSGTDRLAVSTKLRAALLRWAESWPSINSTWLEREVQVDAAEEVAELVLAGQWCQTGAEGVAWSMVGPSGAQTPPRRQGETTPQTALMSALFDESIEPAAISVEQRLSEQLAQESWQEWWSEIGRLLASPERCGEDRTASAAPVALVEGAVASFGGALLARLPWCGEYTLGLLMEASCVQALLAKAEDACAGGAATATATATTASVLDALALRRLPIRAELQQVEIDLGILIGLRVGDVLRTTHRLDDLLTVRGPTSEQVDRSEVLCRAFLGRQSHWRAIELQKADVPSPT